MTASSTILPQARHLADLPGPRGLPLLGNALELDAHRLHLVLERWAREHGDLFRFRLGRTEFLAVGDADVCRDVLHSRPGKIRRISRMEPMFAEMNIMGVFSAEGDTWRRQRRLINPAFKSSHLGLMYPTIARITRRLCDKLGVLAGDGNPIDARDLMIRYTVDVTTEVVFGYELDTIGSGGGQLQRDIKLIFEGLNWRVNAVVPYWRAVRLPRDHRLERALGRTRAVVDQVITDTRDKMAANPECGPATLLEALLLAEDSDEDGERLTGDELFANVITLLLAGEDTTSNTLAWTLWYLGRDPQLQASIHTELDAVLGTGAELDDHRALSSLRLLEGLVQEVMRLKSAGPVMYMETIEDLSIGGVELAAATPVALLTRHVGVQESSFTRANELIPQRWIDEVRPADWNHEPRNHLAFGGGGRICPGRSLAVLESMMLLATVLREFEVDAVPDAPEPEEIFAFTMGPSALSLRFVPRQ